MITSHPESILYLNQNSLLLLSAFLSLNRVRLLIFAITWKQINIGKIKIRSLANAKVSKKQNKTKHTKKKNVRKKLRGIYDYLVTFTAYGLPQL